MIATDFDQLTVTPGLFEFNYKEFFTSHGGYICCKRHTLSSWYWILSSRSRSCEIRLLLIPIFFCLLLSLKCCRVYLNYILTNFNPKVSQWQKFHGHWTKLISLSRWLKNISMVSKELYTLKKKGKRKAFNFTIWWRN